MTDEQFELLSAYADGELGEADRRKIERLLETDEAAREAFAAIEGSRSRLRQAYLATYHGDPPERLIRVLGSGREARRLFSGRSWFVAGTAGGAAFAGIFAGWIAAVGVQSASTEPPLLTASADGLAAGAPLTEFLGNASSGAVSEVAGQPSIVLLSFRSSDGPACRQFQTGATMAVACLEGSGEWKIEATAQASGRVTAGYTTAAGDTPAGIEGTISTLGVSEVFDASGEEQAIASGWR